jgi:hypothetical protein
MGSPPQYEQIPSDDVPVYERSGDLEAGTSNESADSVIITYQPVFPRQGKTEHVVGLRGKGKEVSFGCRLSPTTISTDRSSPLYRCLQEMTALVYRYFPSLANFPSSRLAYEIPVQSHHSDPSNPAGQHGNFLEYARVTDEAWAGFERTPPARIRVVVVDTAADVKQRKSPLLVYGCQFR